MKPTLTIALILMITACSNDPKDVHKDAAKCMSSGDYKCAEEKYLWLLAQKPNDSRFQANLAFALTSQEKHEEAISIYRKLLSEGEGTYDLFAYFAKSLNAVGREEEAITWNYRALSIIPRLVDVRGSLAKILVKNGRSYEALSLLASFDDQLEIQGKGQYFKAQRIAISATLPTPSQTSSTLVQAANIGGHYFSIVLTKNGESIPFMIDTGATHTTMSPQTLRTLGINVPFNTKRVSMQTADKRIITGQQFALSELQVGPFLLKNVQIVVCESCASLLGQTTLERFDLTTTRTDGIDFISMKLRS